jgi:hypothetical protein
LRKSREFSREGTSAKIHNARKKFTPNKLGKKYRKMIKNTNAKNKKSKYRQI